MHPSITVSAGSAFPLMSFIKYEEWRFVLPILLLLNSILQTAHPPSSQTTLPFHALQQNYLPSTSGCGHIFAITKCDAYILIPLQPTSWEDCVTAIHPLEVCPKHSHQEMAVSHPWAVLVLGNSRELKVCLEMDTLMYMTVCHRPTSVCLGNWRGSWNNGCGNLFVHLLCNGN